VAQHPTRTPLDDQPGVEQEVDLDLDVLRFREDRSVLIVDQDEFAEHQIRYAYPPDIVAAAEKAAAWLHGVLGDGTEPFATEYRTWLAMVS